MTWPWPVAKADGSWIMDHGRRKMGGWKVTAAVVTEREMETHRLFSSTAFHLKAPLALCVGLSWMANIKEEYSTG